MRLFIRRSAQTFRALLTKLLVRSERASDEFARVRLKTESADFLMEAMNLARMAPTLGTLLRELGMLPLQGTDGRSCHSRSGDVSTQSAIMRQRDLSLIVYPLHDWVGTRGFFRRGGNRCAKWQEKRS